MKWVSAGPHWIWAVQTNDELWHCAQPCSSSTSWKKAPGLLRNLDMRHGWVYGTNSNGTVFRIRADLSSSWESFPEAGVMDQVSIGQRDVWGVRGGNIYQCQRPCNTSSAWTQVPGQLTYIDAE
ncbi:tectonin domain-containing protein [Ideonella sp.]|uniref:tectonin domain-containing protein n=1 Tax=Ideonella sp. TaxID=1929293 RepID=UPI0037BF8314